MDGRLKGDGPVAMVLFEGGAGAAPPERWLAEVRRAIVLDTAERIAAARLISPLIVSTDDPQLAHQLEELGAGIAVERDAGDPRPFHFGRRLAALVEKYGLERVVAMGGAAAPLLGRRDLEALVGRLRAGTPAVWANNLYSADIIALCPASRLRSVPLPAADNALPYELHVRAGLPLRLLPRTLGLTFDVDTPTDALILALHPGAGPRVRGLLAGHPGLEPLRRVRQLLLDETREVWIAGRIGGRQLQLLDARTKSRLRVLSEARGMKAHGLEARGEVVSLLGFWVDGVGPEGWFAQLARCCHGALMDTRPLFAHLGRRVSQADRFASDLGDVDAIRDPWVRRFTRAAREAPVPVVLGGHSLVTGGLWALLESAAPPARGPGAGERRRFAPRLWKMTPGTRRRASMVR